MPGPVSLRGSIQDRAFRLRTPYRLPRQALAAAIASGRHTWIAAALTAAPQSVHRHAAEDSPLGCRLHHLCVGDVKLPFEVRCRLWPELCGWTLQMCMTRKSGR